MVVWLAWIYPGTDVQTSGSNTRWGEGKLYRPCEKERKSSPGYGYQSIVNILQAFAIPLLYTGTLNQCSFPVFLIFSIFKSQWMNCRTPLSSCFQRNYHGSFIEMIYAPLTGALPVNSMHNHLMDMVHQKYLLLYSDRFLLAISLSGLRTVLCGNIYQLRYGFPATDFQKSLYTATKVLLFWYRYLNWRKTWLCSLTARNSVTLQISINVQNASKIIRFGKSP